MAKRRTRLAGSPAPLSIWGFLALCAALAAANAPSAEEVKPVNPSPAEEKSAAKPAAPAEAKAPDSSAAKPAAAAEAKDAKSAEPEEPAKYNNWLDLSLGGIHVEGDAPQFQHHQQFEKGVFGGIEDFHYERRIGKKGSAQVDGSGIYDQNNYKMSLEYVQQDLGFLRGGFRKYRTWYDGNGGFFPQNQQWFDLYDNNLAMDRGNFWIEGGLLRPKWPEFRIKYEHDFREGAKDSTSWGDSTLTGGLGTRSFVPSFLGIDEKRDLIDASMKHTVGKTDLNVGVSFERDANQDTLNLRRQPGEGASQDRSVTQRNGMDADIFGAHASSVTRFNPNTYLTTGYAFTVLESDLSGQRVYGAGYDPVYDPLFQRRAADVGFVGLNGGSDMKQHVLSLNLMTSPLTNFFLTPSLRVEKRDVTSFSSFLTTGPAAQEQSAWGNGADGLIEVSERLEAKYNGVTNWVFYARGDWNQGQGNLKEALIDNAPSPLLAPFNRDTDYSRLTQKYTAGANWYPLRRLNIDWQYYHKLTDNSYDHGGDSTPNGPASGNRYPAYFIGQNFTTDDANLRATIRPLNNLTLVSRYDFQYSTIDTTPDQRSGIQSGKMFTHVFSQSLTWMPWSRLYLQPSVTYVIDRTDTPAADLTGAAAGLASNARNNYLDGGLMAGYALSEKTDLQAHYFFYYADNYFNDSSLTMPYGASATEHGVTVALIHRFSERIRGMIKYGYFQNRDGTSGGHNDYDAHLLYTSLQYRF